MEDNVPELPVETENVRKNSNSTSDIKVMQSDVSDVATRKSSLVVSKTTGDLYTEIKSESSIKRVDSDSKFGVMETISLDISVQDTLTASEATEICENPLLQKRDSLKDSEEIGESKKLVEDKSELTSSTGPNSLSKYFNTPVENVTINTETLQFFDKLSEGSCNSKSDTSNTTDYDKIETKENVLSSEQANNELESTVLGSGELSQPPLLKFFAEEKSGKDRDGKAFFDKIASVKDSGDAGILEINQPILSSATASGDFLVSPVLSGEIEDAWIPLEKTQQILVAINTSENYVPDKSMLTCPEMELEEDLDDPVKSLLAECNSPLVHQRKVLTCNDVSADEAGLQKLIEAECYHAAINLTKRLITSYSQNANGDKQPKHTPLLLRIWYTRLALLVKLKKFSMAEVEGATFNNFDRPDMYYEFYPDTYKAKKGTMVPFSFRVLLAELPQYQGNHQTALDNMYQILNIVQKIIQNLKNGCAEDGSMIEMSESRKKASLEIWNKREQRVFYSILNCVLSQKDYILAVSLAKKLINKSKENTPELISALGRIYLQLGDVKLAQECFNKASTAACEKSQQFLVEDYINKALLAITYSNNEEAYKHYQQAYNLTPNNAMLANNMAVCLLYMGRLKESLALLEQTIHKNPSACLHDGILFNTCTLYELESSRCTQKKLGMLELLSKYAGDSFNVSCLKIQIIK